MRAIAERWGARLLAVAETHHCFLGEDELL